MILEFLRKPQRAVPERKASAGARVAVWGQFGPRGLEPAGHPSLTRNGFLGNPVGYRAVKLIAEAAAALPVICQDVTRRYDTIRR
jgi:phage portal protein BeeE